MSEPSPREPMDLDRYPDESQYPPDLRFPDQETTLDVIMGLRLQDPAAEKEFVDRFVPMLWRRAHRRPSQPARRVQDTEDIVQSALCDLLR